MDADTRELLAGSIRELLRSPGELVSGLDELGWAEVVSDDPAAAIELLFTEQGRAGAASGALDRIVVDAAAPVSGPVFVVHPFGSATSTVIGERLNVDGVALTEPEPGACYVVLVGDAVFTVPVDDSAAEVRGFDPASRLRRVRLSANAFQGHADNGITATAAARRALASELIGNGRAMLDIAVARSPSVGNSEGRSGPIRPRAIASPTHTFNCRARPNSSRSPGPAAPRGMPRSPRPTPARPSR